MDSHPTLGPEVARAPGGPSLMLVRLERDASELEGALRRAREHGVQVLSPAEALERARRPDPGVLLVDASAEGPGASGRAAEGLDLAAALTRDGTDLAVVLAVGLPPTTEMALRGLRCGLRDLLSPTDAERAANRLLQEADLLHATRPSPPGERTSVEDLPGLFGRSELFQKTCARLARAAASDVPVLILGETGTGKELAARALHARSPRCDGPLVAVNCMAIPEPLLESELFGHAQGSFSDARAPRTGLFRRADGGTLLLDEIGEMPLPLQGKLLRALEAGRVRPVGSDVEQAVDVRVVSATNLPLEEAVRAGRFRDDLFFRLDVLRVELPPLRDRGMDVLLLAREFLRRATNRAGRDLEGLSPGAARCLLRYAWPGNVRELRNAIDHAVALSEGPLLDARDLPGPVREGSPARQAAPAPDASGIPLLTLEELERQHLRRALRATRGNKAEAARLLGIDRSTLYRKLRRHGLRPER